jgi:diaminopimelate decarboxylase
VKISWQSLDELEKNYGDSFYILDIRKFQANYQEFLTSFRSIYSNSNIGYSYKTNYTPKICQCVNSMGGYAEVVSQLEYDLAIRIGVHPSRIIFNGPLKLREDIENVILAGSIVNLDSLHEVSIVKALAERLPDRQIAVGLRCNFDIGAGISRFGFDEGGELQYAFKTLNHLKNCSVEGLHCHFATPERSVKSYALRANKMLGLSNLYFREYQPKFISLGGGFFGKMGEDLRKQFDCSVPSYQDYAQAIASQFKNQFPNDSGPELILEPGVAVVADVMKFVGKIVGVKNVRSRKLALATGSIQNIKPTLNDKNLLMKIYRDDGSLNQEKLIGPVDIVGYTCMEHDCLYKEYQGEIAVGDYVVFDNVGAYTTVFKPPFIRSSPPIISYDSTLDEYELSKRRETSQDLFATYVI